MIAVNPETSREHDSRKAVLLGNGARWGDCAVFWDRLQTGVVSMRSIRVVGQSAWEKRRRQTPERTDGYQYRDAILKELGYKNYTEYLKSDDWRTLRDEVLTFRKRCSVCDDAATVVHHYSYEAAVILGMQKRLLLPLCDGCHEFIEIDADGNKRTLPSAQGTILRMLREVGKTRLMQQIQRSHNHAIELSTVKPKKNNRRR